MRRVAGWDISLLGGVLAYFANRRTQQWRVALWIMGIRFPTEEETYQSEKRAG